MTDLPAHLERVILTGFMGSGKTTVGRLLAARLQWSFADLDDAVELQQGLRVSEIFEQHGEPVFRRAEAEALAGLLEQSKVVIALGGGAAFTPTVRELIANVSGTTVVHLHAGFDVLEQRCRLQALDPTATARPLIGDSLAARSRYGERAPSYAALAHQVVDVSTSSPEKIVEEILGAWSAPTDSRRS